MIWVMVTKGPSGATVDSKCSLQRKPDSMFDLMTWTFTRFFCSFFLIFHDQRCVAQTDLAILWALKLQTLSPSPLSSPPPDPTFIHAHLIPDSGEKNDDKLYFFFREKASEVGQSPMTQSRIGRICLVSFITAVSEPRVDHRGWKVHIFPIMVSSGPVFVSQQPLRGGSLPVIASNCKSHKLQRSPATRPKTKACAVYPRLLSLALALCYFSSSGWNGRVKELHTQGCFSCVHRDAAAAWSGTLNQSNVQIWAIVTRDIYFEKEKALLLALCFPHSTNSTLSGNCNCHYWLHILTFFVTSFSPGERLLLRNKKEGRSFCIASHVELFWQTWLLFSKSPNSSSSVSLCKWREIVDHKFHKKCCLRIQG